MANVTIKRRADYQRADGEAALYAIVNIQRTKLRIPLGISVSSQDWDSLAQRIRGRSQEAKDKNLIISNTRAKISDILVRARLTGESLTKERFMEMYRRPGETTDFNDFAELHLKEMTRAFQPETIRHHKAALKKLKAYAPKLEISQITPEWLQTYAAHLRKRYDNNSGTIRKNMCVIRMHYYAAIRAGKVKVNPFDVYKLPAADPLIVFLSESEFNTLLDLFREDSLPKNEQDVLRFFLFMAFTGMHISDARVLQIEQIEGGEIHYTRMKTHIRVQVPVSKSAAKLVDYYKDGRQKGNLFRNLPTDQAFNRIIKKICKKVNIHKAVSAKAARHTFATLFFIKTHGDIATLSKLLGHVQINTTMVYLHLLKENRAAGISVFDDML